MGVRKRSITAEERAAVERLVVNVSPVAGMAIRLRSVKSGLSLGDLLDQMVRRLHPDEVQEAEKEIAGK